MLRLLFAFSRSLLHFALVVSASEPVITQRLNPLHSAERTYEHDNRKAVSEMQQWIEKSIHTHIHKALAYEYKSEANSKEAICANVLLHSVIDDDDDDDGGGGSGGGGTTTQKQSPLEGI